MIRFVLILMQLFGFIPPSGVQPAQGTPRYPLITVENAHQLAVAAIVRSADFPGENDFRSGAQFAFSPDSTMLAVALNYDIGLADALTGEVVGTMEKKEGLARHRSFGLYFSPDGSLLASAGDGWVTLWNVDDRVGIFSDHADYQHTFRYSVTISPDNQFLYLYSADFSQRNNVLHVWDIGRQREVDRTEFCAVYVLRGYEALCDTGVSAPGFAFMDLTTFGTVSILPVSETRFRLDRYALSPDGRLFAFYFLYVENEQPVNMYYLLDLDTQEIIQRRAVTYIADSYAAPVGRFTINPSGELLIYQDGNLMKLVDAMTGDVLISFASQRSWNYNYVQFSPDGTLLALGDLPPRANYP